MTEVASLRSVAAFVRPASVAIVGASPSLPLPIENAVRGGMPVWGVNPSRSEVAGITCFPSIAALPSTPDLVMLLVGHGRVEAAFDDCVAAGVRSVFLPGLGNEAGAEGPPIVESLTRRAAEAGVALQGPNCMGVATPGGFSTWLGTLPPAFVAGSIGLVTQSGSIGEATTALGPRVGFSSIVSVGGEANRDVADFLADFADRDDTRAIGVFIEGVRRAPALAAALDRCAAAGKPVVCLKVGRSEAAARSALAHTGALVGSQVAFSAFIRHHGAIEVRDYPDLVETLEVLGRRRRPRGARLAAVSESGGESSLLADQAEDAGLRFEPLSDTVVDAFRGRFANFRTAGNPFDAWAVDEPEIVYPESLDILGRSGDADVLIAQIDLSRYRGAWEQGWCDLIVEALATTADRYDLFPAVVTMHTSDPPDSTVELARSRDVALLRGSGAAMRAIAAALSWSGVGDADDPPRDRVELDDLLFAQVVAEHESSLALERYGIAFARRLRAGDPGEAARAAEALGLPVVVKVDGVAHKAAAAGVFLDVRTAEEAAGAAERIGGPVIVAERIAPGVEAFCGMLRDEQFGPVVVIGRGGASVETSGGTVAALAPVAIGRARGMVVEAGLEDVGDALAIAVVALGRLALDHPRVKAVDVNPIILGPAGAVAVDALIELGIEENLGE